MLSVPRDTGLSHPPEQGLPWCRPPAVGATSINPVYGFAHSMAVNLWLASVRSPRLLSQHHSSFLAMLEPTAKHKQIHNQISGLAEREKGWNKKCVVAVMPHGWSLRD